jgi:hypothetical protein
VPCRRHALHRCVVKAELIVHEQGFISVERTLPSTVENVTELGSGSGGGGGGGGGGWGHIGCYV